MSVVDKLKIDDINSESLKKEGDKELLNLHRHLHGLWVLVKEGKDVGHSLEDIWNAHELVVSEIERRGMTHGSPLGRKLPVKKDINVDQNLNMTANNLPEELAPVKPSGNKQGVVIKLEEVLPHLKSFKIRQPLMFLVGGIVNNGQTEGDIDIQVKGKLPPGMLKIIQFRLGRMLPKELSSRISVMGDEYDGPFTNNIPLGDLMFKVNDPLTILKMSEGFSESDFINSEETLLDSDILDEELLGIVEISKQDPMMFYPKDPGKRKAVLQIHARGKSAHGDLRLDIGKELIGWTLFWQKPGKVQEIKTVAEASKLMTGFDMEKGNEYFKPILAPAGLQMVTKKPEPLDWIAVEGVIEPGNVGATAYESGVFAMVEDSKDFRAEWGIQKPHFHEYFLTGGKYINGTLYVRLLSSAGYERAGGGPTLWRGFISKDYLPSVLNQRSVETGSMPPDGVSAMPVSLMKQTPEEFRFWTKKGKEAKEIRDKLVASKYFTDENVVLKDGEYTRVEKQQKKLDIRRVMKKEVPFVFQYQMWKGQLVGRVGPSREQWVFYIDEIPGDSVQAFIFEQDPTKNIKSVAIGETRSRKYLDLDGDIKPGELGNETKNTPSWAQKIDAGKAILFENSPNVVKFKVDLKHIKGVWILSREEPGSNIWKVEFEANDSPKTKGVIKDDDIFPSIKADFKPLIHFDPLKPSAGFNKGEFFNVDELVNNFAGRILGANGKLVINPKWNGFRTVIEKKGEGKEADVIIWFEDKQDDRSHLFPALVEEIKGIKGDFILDCELMEYTDSKHNAVLNRKELVKWATSTKPIDDSNIVCKVFGILYWNESLLREKAETIADLVDEKIKGFKHLEPTEHWLVTNEKELRDKINIAKDLVGSEGAMVKLWNSTYTLSGRTDSWVKYKVPRIVDAIVLEIHKVAKTDKTFNYTGGIGPIPAADKDKFDKSRELNGKWYVEIGQTFNTNIAAKVGDVITITASEIFNDSEEGKEHLAWFLPIVSALSESDSPDNIETIRRLGLGKVEKESLEIYAPIFKVDTEERMVYGIVLEPNVTDAQGDIISAEEIRKACHYFMENWQKIGYQHEEFDRKFKIMECYLAPADINIGGQEIRKGTWLMVTRVIDDAAWKEVKEGKITGYSIGGVGKRTKRPS